MMLFRISPAPASSAPSSFSSFSFFLFFFSLVSSFIRNNQAAGIRWLTSSSFTPLVKPINWWKQSAQVPHIIILCLYDRVRYNTTSKFYHNLIWLNSSPSSSGWTTIIRLSSKPNSIFSVILQPWWICLSLLFALSSMLRATFWTTIHLAHNCMADIYWLSWVGNLYS